MAESHVYFGHGQLGALSALVAVWAVTTGENEQIAMICSRHGTHRFTLCHVDGGGLSRVDGQPWSEDPDGINDSTAFPLPLPFPYPSDGALV